MGAALLIIAFIVVSGFVFVILRNSRARARLRAVVEIGVASTNEL